MNTPTSNLTVQFSVGISSFDDFTRIGIFISTEDTEECEPVFVNILPKEVDSSIARSFKVRSAFPLDKIEGLLYPITDIITVSVEGTLYVNRIAIRNINVMKISINDSYSSKKSGNAVSDTFSINHSKLENPRVIRIIGYK